MNKQNLFWTILVSLLVIINIISLSILWKGRPGHRLAESRLDHEKRHKRTEKMIHKRLGLDEAQMIEFKDARQRHFQKTREIEKQLKEKKKILFQKNMNGVNLNDVTPLMEDISRLHLKIDSLTYEHFAELRSYCRPDQIEDFDRFLKSMLQREFGNRELRHHQSRKSR